MMSSFMPSAQKLGPIGTSVPQKSEQQNLIGRILGGGRGAGAGDLRRLGGGKGGGGQLIGDGRGSRASLGEESELERKILATHQGAEERIHVTSILRVIDVIFHRATADIPGFIQGTLTQKDIVVADENALHSAVALQDIIELPPRVTSAISCEIASKITTGVDVNTIVMEILGTIKHYRWDSKVVLALVSFAVIFGEFRLTVQLHHTNPLAKSVALLKQLPKVLEHVGALKPTLDALFALITEIIDVTKKIVEFYELPLNEYFTADSPELVAASSHIPIAVYWTIRSIVVSTTQILALTGIGIEYLTEPWELSPLAHKLSNIKGHLVDIMQRIYKFIEWEKEKELLEALHRLFTSMHIDNSKTLSALFHYKDGQPALYDCNKKQRVSTDDLRKKIVALFITDLDPELVRGQEYTILHHMYHEKNTDLTRIESQYEVVWVPVVDSWSEDKYRLFETLRNQMAWHSVHHPSVVSPVVIRFIKEKWNFTKMPMLVVMDTHGRIVHRNAIHMMCIWGSLAYPFDETKEKLLWDGTSWSLELLADNLEPNMGLWLQEGKYICLYGGENIDWIRRFTRIAKDVARESGFALELLYVGMRAAKERAVRDIIATIMNEKLSHALDHNLIWYFWLRLESMWHSKGRLSKSEKLKNDPVTSNIIAMLSYGSSEGGWALFSSGLTEMTKSNGENMYKALAEHAQWRANEAAIGFVPALDEYLHKIQREVPHHCASLFLPATEALPESVACSECGRLMERFTMFRCCTD